MLLSHFYYILGDFLQCYDWVNICFAVCIALFLIVVDVRCVLVAVHGAENSCVLLRVSICLLASLSIKIVLTSQNDSVLVLNMS